MRTITFTIEGERLLPSHPLAGQAGEHLDTQLSFDLPQEWQDMDEYRLHFCTDTCRNYSTVPLTAPVRFSLPQVLMAAGTLHLFLEGRRGTQIHRTSMARLLVEECPDVPCGETEIDDPMEGLVQSALRDFVQAMSRLEEAEGEAKALRQETDDCTRAIVSLTARVEALEKVLSPAGQP